MKSLLELERGLTAVAVRRHCYGVLANCDGQLADSVAVTQTLIFTEQDYSSRNSCRYVLILFIVCYLQCEAVSQIDYFDFPQGSPIRVPSSRILS